MSRLKVVLCNRKGLHARAAGKLVAVVSQFESSLKVHFKDRTADGSSILNLLTLGAPFKSELELSACGEDAEAMLDAVKKLVESGFDEQEESC